jgi:hypothetical protein
MHATHTVHAVPDFRIAAGRLRDGFVFEVVVVIAFLVTTHHYIRDSRTCKLFSDLLSGNKSFGSVLPGVAGCYNFNWMRDLRFAN